MGVPLDANWAIIPKMEIPDRLVSRSILITLRLFLSARNEICSPLHDRFFVPPMSIKSSSPTNDVVPSS